MMIMLDNDDDPKAILAKLTRRSSLVSPLVRRRPLLGLEQIVEIITVKKEKEKQFLFLSFLSAAAWAGTYCHHHHRQSHQG